MDPYTPFSSQPFNNNGIFMVALFASLGEQEDYLKSLDSDTRDYVLKHTDEFRTKEDIQDCIRKLHGGSLRAGS